jgi:predicted nucleic acid-binding protein
MKGILVDASFSASWFLDDERHESSAKVLDEAQSGKPVSVPSLWLLEITNLLFVAQRRGRIDPKYRDEAIARIPRLSLSILPPPSLIDLPTLRHFSDKYQLTAYDAEYLRVATEQGLTLASFDRQLLAAAVREKVQVISSD